MLSKRAILIILKYLLSIIVMIVFVRSLYIISENIMLKRELEKAKLNKQNYVDQLDEISYVLEIYGDNIKKASLDSTIQRYTSTKNEELQSLGYLLIERIPNTCSENITQGYNTSINYIFDDQGHLTDVNIDM